ncbi:MAG: hypothetical protein ACKKL6_04110 [Candidatus Komeilibacteria bacterium]
MYNQLNGFHVLLISIAALAVIGLILVLGIGMKKERDVKKITMNNKNALE